MALQPMQRPNLSASRTAFLLYGMIMAGNLRNKRGMKSGQYSILFTASLGLSDFFDINFYSVLFLCGI